MTRTALMSFSQKLILIVIGLVALCATTPADAGPEIVHLVFSNHLVSDASRIVLSKQYACAVSHDLHMLTGCWV